MLREYQERALNRLRESIASGKKRVVLVAPTGAGKSVLAYEMVKGALEKGRRVLFVVNRIQLVSQFAERLTRAGIPHGILRGEDSKREYEHALVASIQTIARRGTPDQFDLIVIDEAHATPGSKDYRKLLRQNKGAVVIGMTATPWSVGMAAHDEGLGGPVFEDCIVAATYSELIGLGHLVDCDCYAPSIPDLTGVRTRRDQFGDIDYVESDLEGAVNKPVLVGSIVEHWQKHAKDTPTVVFATSIAHSKAIVSMFREAGVAAEHIDAYCSPAERREVLGRVDRGETRVVSCVALLSEGWDQPSIKTMILARPTKSEIRYVQMVGRILRPHPGKERALLLDHSGSVLRLGYPTADRDYVLDDGSVKRTGKRVRVVREPRRCPSCGFMDKYWSNPCEVCGHKFVSRADAIHVGGDLLKIDVPRAPIKVSRQQVYSYLLWVAAARKYKKGWAAIRYKKRFGGWPKGLRDIPEQPPPWFMRTV